MRPGNARKEPPHSATAARLRHACCADTPAEAVRRGGGAYRGDDRRRDVSAGNIVAPRAGADAAFRHRAAVDPRSFVRAQPDGAADDQLRRTGAGDHTDAGSIDHRTLRRGAPFPDTPQCRGALPGGARPLRDRRRPHRCHAAHRAGSRAAGARAAAQREARGDADRFEQTDVGFHYVLATITGNPIFTAVHDALVDWLTSQRTIALSVAGVEAAALAAHQRIFDAVRQGDPNAAGEAMARHLQEISEIIQRASACAGTER